jgi:SAM-dependent methyltransferase
MTDAVAWYDANAEAAVARHEETTAETIHGWLMDWLPGKSGTILDVGAGTGRDAAWLASKGHEVVAVEPSAAMRDAAVRLHPDMGIRWIDDSLPALATVNQTGLSFDIILLNAVWMHVTPIDRMRAFRKLINLLKWQEPSGQRRPQLREWLTGVPRHLNEYGRMPPCRWDIGQQHEDTK